ncbi:hypothetical protein Hokovirus_1_352, partial [Hokovirus HKV1]
MNSTNNSNNNSNDNSNKLALVRDTQKRLKALRRKLLNKFNLKNELRHLFEYEVPAFVQGQLNDLFENA